MTNYNDIQPGMRFKAGSNETWVVLRKAIEGELCHDITKLGAYTRVNKQRGYLWWCKHVEASDYAAMLCCFSDCVSPETCAPYEFQSGL